MDLKEMYFANPRYTNHNLNINKSNAHQMNAFWFISCIVLVCAILLPALCFAGGTNMRNTEPNYSNMAALWPEMPNVWTPVGWIDHLFRFNVVYTGLIVAEPHPAIPFTKKHTEQYAGQGIQLTLLPSTNGALPEVRNETYQLTDDNSNRTGSQGWEDTPAPVLWTKWKQQPLSSLGLVMKSRMFAHIPGGGNIITGTESLFGWVRISVDKKNPLWPVGTAGMLIKINAPHMGFGMNAHFNCLVMPANSKYPHDLKFEAIGDGKPGCVLFEGDNVRMAVVPGTASGIDFYDRSAKSAEAAKDKTHLMPGMEIKTAPVGVSGEGRDYYLHVTIPATDNAYFDVLLPFLPVDKATFDKELALGYDGALAQTNRYWASLPNTAAKIDVPEPQINKAIKALVDSAQVIAERNPDNGDYSLLTGSYVYTSAWPTPMSMTCHTLLDPLGRHDAVEKYLKIYKDNQGKLGAPGPSYKPHPGYLGAPRTLSAIDWIPDHGAVLYTMAYHALITGDKKFIDDYLPCMIKACEFIKDSRANHNHSGIPGLLPPGSATDAAEPVQSVWSDGWCYKGLAEAAQLLRRIKHPRAAEFTKEAQSYKSAIASALKQATLKMPLWIDAKGVKQHIIPGELGNYGGYNQSYYLDCGPLFLTYAGVMDGKDPTMQSALAYLREGPNTHLYDPLGTFVQPAVIWNGISSSEPCYSWNVFAEWSTGSREDFLRGMYSMFVGGMSQNTSSCCETRGGVSGLTPCVPAVYLARISVIDDQIDDDELHLLRLCPLAWLRTDKQTKFENIPTIYGPVTLKFKLADDSKRLDVEYKPSFRNAPKKEVLSIPPVDGLKTISVNGKNYKCTGKQLVLSAPASK